MKQKTTTLTGEENVQALIDALSGDTDAEKTAFGKRLLACFGAGTRQADLAAIDLLLEMTRMVLEGELEHALVQLARPDLNRTETNRQAALFWGALTLHAELFLRLPAPGHAPLVEEIGGELVVRQEGVQPYSFQGKLSAARAKSLFATLGAEWLTRYLDACVLNKKISQLFHDKNQSQKTITDWIGLVSVRTLERAQKQVRGRLWDQYGDDKKVGPERPSIRLELQLGSLTAEKPLQPQQTDRHRDLLTQYKKGLLEKLAYLDSQPFVRPELQVEDDKGNLAPAELEALVQIQGVCLLAGLPGGGKSYLQAWAARQRLLEGQGLDIFVNLDEYARSGLTSLFEYAADRLRRDFDLPVGQDDLRSALIELDRQGEVVWWVDNWDRLWLEESERVLIGLAGLTNALISTADPQMFARVAQERSLKSPQWVCRILPWSRDKQEDYLALYEQVHPEFKRDLALSLMEQLPGLARLPAGMTLLLARKETGLVEALLDYLDAGQKALGDRGVTLRLDHNHSVDWGSAALNSIYSGVSALMQHGLSGRYDPSRLERFDRVILGAGLLEKTESLEHRMKRADEILNAGLRSGLLAREEPNQYEFVVPEIGSLIAALAVYGPNSAGFIQGQPQNVAASHTGAPAAVLKDISRWIKTALHN